MNAIRAHAVVQSEGRIILDKLPLEVGQTVEVLVLSPSLGDLAVGPSTGQSLRQKLLDAPCIPDDQLEKVEEVRAWLAKWPTAF